MRQSKRGDANAACVAVRGQGPRRTFTTSADVPLLNHSGRGHGVTSDDVQPILCGLNGRLVAISNGIALSDIIDIGYLSRRLIFEF